MKSENLKQGISLIVLVITIIVIIILAGAVILSLANNNPISNATEAAFKSDLTSYNSELNLAISKKYADNFSFDPSIFNAAIWDGSASTAGTVKEVIPSMKVEDANKYLISQGKLYYVGSETDKKQWAKGLGVTDGMILNIDGDDFTNSPQTVTWNDKTGNNNNASPVNFGYTSTSGSDGAGSIAFDGVDDYMNVNNTFNILYNTSTTISVWINASTIAKNYVILGKNAFEYLIYQEADKFGFIQWNSAGENSISIKTDSCITAGQWINVVYRYDNSTKVGSLYVNGQFKTSAISYYNELKQTTETLKIGTGYGWGGKFTEKFKGKISNICYYNRALSATEILQLYNAGK